MQYQTLTADDLAAIAQERVRELEIDHARAALILTELPGGDSDPAAAGLHTRMADLERRVGLYGPSLDGADAGAAPRDELIGGDKAREVGDYLREALLSGRTLDEALGMVAHVFDTK